MHAARKPTYHLYVCAGNSPSLTATEENMMVRTIILAVLHGLQMFLMSELDCDFSNQLIQRVD